MKTFQGWLNGVVLLTALLACSPKTRPVTERRAVNYFRYEPGRAPLISVHRGGGDLKGYPENCIESFEYVVEQLRPYGQPTIIECDIDLTRDSILVMMHDATLDRTTTGTGKLIEKTFAETQALRLEDNFGTATNFKIPTLDAVLRWGKGRTLFTLDVKRNVRFADVVALVRTTGSAGNAAIITYNANDAALVHKLAPELMISVGIRSVADYERLRSLGLPDDRMIAFVGTREPDKSLYEFLHGRGIACILGTLGNLDKQAAAKGDAVYKKFVENGADIMSTDRPLEMAKAIYPARQ